VETFVRPCGLNIIAIKSTKNFTGQFKVYH